MPQNVNNEKSTLVQVMAWCRQATSHYLSQCWLRSPTPYGINQPQWTELILLVVWWVINASQLIWGNYANPVYGVAIICHQVRCLRWGHQSLFHTVISLLIWYEMFCMRDISYRLIWMKFINMLSVYAQSGTHRHFHWWIIAVST